MFFADTCIKFSFREKKTYEKYQEYIHFETHFHDIIRIGMPTRTISLTRFDFSVSLPSYMDYIVYSKLWFQFMVSRCFFYAFSIIILFIRLTIIINISGGTNRGGGVTKIW